MREVFKHKMANKKAQLGLLLWIVIVPCLIILAWWGIAMGWEWFTDLSLVKGIVSASKWLMGLN